MNRCLLCDTDLDGATYTGGEHGFQFCDDCCRKLESVEVDLAKAEKILRKTKEGR